MLPTPSQLTKGITRLTNVLPHFYLLVDTDTLDCRYWDICLLGQVFGHFNIGVDTLRMSYQDAVDEGFILNISCEHEEYDRLYKELDYMWIELVEERKQ